MGFVQIIDFHSSKADEIRALADEWERATEGRQKTRKRVLCEDREHRGHYLTMVFFDSYEDAMANSALPETDAFSKKMAILTEGAPTFLDLDVVEDR